MMMKYADGGDGRKPGSVSRAGAGGGTLLAFRASPGYNMAAVIQWHRD